MYQALYRKYRPVTFTDVISQEPITQTLRNQIKSGKTAHAYLFTGSRGTGKTTCARIFAKALNCENPQDGNPCNECSVCRDADNFALSDIIEIDAASNGSVDDARELREAALYTPERCKYKVYIIDEVHMLSKDAFNALLKIIEEPPEHVKFIMATTELHKVLPTILSRCQRYDFNRVRSEDIAARIKEVAQKENVTVDADGADLIAKLADGGMRDALSLLDRCIAFSDNITADVVSEASGIAGRGYLFDIAKGIADKDTAACLGVIDELYARSKDMTKLCEELILQFRNVLIAVTAPSRTDMILCLPSELERIKALAAQMPAERVIAVIDELSARLMRMRNALSKRTELEMCIIALCTEASPSSGADSASSEEIRRLESTVAQLQSVIRDMQLNGAAMQQPRRISPPKGAAPPIPENLTQSDFVPIPKWQAAVEEMTRRAAAIGSGMANSWGYTKGKILIINTRSSHLLGGLLGQDDNKQKVLAAVFDVTGLQLENVMVGYRPGLDKGRADGGGSQDSAPTGPTLDTLLDRARSAGIPVE